MKLTSNLFNININKNFKNTRKNVYKLIAVYPKIYICTDFPLLLTFLLIFMNMQIMQIWYVAYLTMEWKAYVLALFYYKF